MNDKDELKSSKHGLFEIHPFVEAYFRCDNGNSEKSKDLVKDRASVSSIARIAAWCIFFPMVALFIRPSRAANLPPPSSLYAQSANPPTSVDHSSNHSTVPYAPKEKKSSLERGSVQHPFLRGGPVLRLRGGNSFGDPTCVSSVLNTHPIRVPLQARPKSVYASTSSESRPKVMRRDSLHRSTTVDHPSNQSSLSLNRKSSSDLINTNVSDTFLGRTGHLTDQGLVVADAYRRGTEGHTPNNTQNLGRMQEITKYSDFVYENDKEEWRREINNAIKTKSYEFKKAEANLKKVEEENGTREQINAKREQVEELQENLKREIRWQRFIFNNILGRDKAVMRSWRNPLNKSHGDFAFTFQAFNQNKLIAKDKDIVNHNLPLYLWESLNQIKANTITPAKKVEFERITSNALEFSFDFNEVRLKIAKPIRKGITLLERDKPCKLYKGDIFKSEPNAVSLSLWNSVRKKYGEDMMRGIS